jgi:hypothetical protein
MKKWPLIRRVDANIMNKQSQTADNRVSSSLGLGEVVTIPHRMNVPSYEIITQ